MKLINSYNVTKIDLINARASKAFKELANSEPVTPTGIALAEDADEDGVVKTFAYIFTANEVYAGNANAIVSSVADLIDVLNDADADETVDLKIEDIKIGVNRGTSKGGREFFTLRVVQ